MGCAGSINSRGRDTGMVNSPNERSAAGQAAQRAPSVNADQTAARAGRSPTTANSANQVREIPSMKSFASIRSAKLADDFLIVELDATASLEATVYIDGTETCDEASGSIPVITAVHEHKSSIVDGMNQTVSLGPLGALADEPPADGFALCVLLEKPLALSDEVSRMYWYGSKNADTGIQWLRQRVVRDGRSHVAHALFGSLKPDSTEGDECVICLSNPKEVVILHCRHVCLCKHCSTITSSTWSYQCPVCRGRVSAMCALADT